VKQKEDKELLKAIAKLSGYTIFIAMIAVACIVMLMICLFNNGQISVSGPQMAQNKAISNSLSAPATVNTARNIPADAWKAPGANTIPAGKTGDMIRYGSELLAHTADYLGPNGSVARISNGMNCQNCHLDGGTRLFGNNYASFIASYPKLSGRSGKVEPATERLAECFNRSLAGQVPDTNGREVQAMLAYMKWIGQGVKKGQKLFGSATEKLPYLDNAADPVKGKEVYVAKCQSCHGKNGEGLMAGKRSYTYPPLWGEHSYNDGAGIYRIGNFAGFVKNNMPFGASYQNPQLTDKEAWDVAAFVNSQPRPHKDQHNDWKDLKVKPIDFPFGPYADGCSEKQHKYGPFKPIKDAQKEPRNKTS
jgi:thiosulfate dehydrogenase